jgi:hypothetical protein
MGAAGAFIPTIAALRVQPFERCDELRGQLNAFRIDAEAALVDLAFPGDHIEIAARRLGIEDRSVVVFDFLKAAETALPALCFPRFGRSSFCTFPSCIHISLHLPTVQS